MHDGYNGNLKNQEIQRLQDIIDKLEEQLESLRASVFQYDYSETERPYSVFERVNELLGQLAEKDEVITALRMGWDEAIREFQSYKIEQHENQLDLMDKIAELKYDLVIAKHWKQI
jgi:predicted RNase H-like nuclease (RuvC/YqgF family)